MVTCAFVVAIFAVRSVTRTESTSSREVMFGDHVHMFVSLPPELSISDLLRKIKKRSSYRVQREFAHIRKLFGGRGSRILGSLLSPTVPSQSTLYFRSTLTLSLRKLEMREI